MHIFILYRLEVLSLDLRKTFEPYEDDRALAILPLLGWMQTEVLLVSRIHLMGNW